jgi:hypothetical protein
MEVVLDKVAYGSSPEEIHSAARSSEALVGSPMPLAK